jgi:hypothetical protein
VLLLELGLFVQSVRQNPLYLDIQVLLNLQLLVAWSCRCIICGCGNIRADCVAANHGGAVHSALLPATAVSVLVSATMLRLK